jgi:hypothetical protein
VPLLDQHGRVFGRFNVIDTVVGAVLALLVPLAYGTYLLFRPVTPRIDSVTRVSISREELRLAGGSMLSAKLKVRGAGFNPMLRAKIGDTAAMGFVFEDPTSADIILGAIPAGSHDLVLYDGVQEVARAVGAVTIESPTAASVRLVGWLLDLEPEDAQALRVTPAGERNPGVVTIVALGPEEPARERIDWFGRSVDVTVPNRSEREAVIDVPCDPRPTNDGCSVTGVPLAPPYRTIVPLATTTGIFRLAITEVLPTVPPTPASVRVRFSGQSELRMISVGDRDRSLDERAAIVETVDVNGTTAAVTLRLRVDASRDGWRYRGRPIAPGAAIELSTDRYALSGTVESITLHDDHDRHEGSP